MNNFSYAFFGGFLSVFIPGILLLVCFILILAGMWLSTAKREDISREWFHISLCVITGFFGTTMEAFSRLAGREPYPIPAIWYTTIAITLIGYLYNLFRYD